MKTKIIAGLTALAAVLSMAGCMTAGGTTGTTDAAAGGSSWLLIIGYFVIIIGVMYFIAIRPQKKEQKKQSEMLSTLDIGYTVLTTSGFYGVVIDITDDTVIVEFGNNKNCRIPMQKSAIVECEAPDAE